MKLKRGSRIHLEMDDLSRRHQEQENVTRLIEKYGLEVMVAEKGPRGSENLSYRVVSSTCWFAGFLLHFVHYCTIYLN